MDIANKTISTQFLNIIIRGNHGQTEIVMQYWGLWSSATCVTTSCRNYSFASPTHRTNQSLDNFELSAPIMVDSSPDHNTYASKMVGLVHTLVRKTFPMPVVHTITSIAKAKWNPGIITKRDVLPGVKPQTTASTSPCWSRNPMVVLKDSFYYQTPSLLSRST